MNLDELQLKQVTAWIAEGLKISEVQKRMETELGLKMTYLEVRLLLDDLRVMPKDQFRQPAIAITPDASAAVPSSPEETLLADDASPEPPSGVKVTVDALARPGAMASGNVTFSDGITAVWYLDQYGRLGLTAPTKGYKPVEADVAAFQKALQLELAKLGF
jgi:hypothetical protein